MNKESTIDHVIYIAKFPIETSKYGSGLSYFQKQYGTENIIHTHKKDVFTTVKSEIHLTSPRVEFEEVTDVDTMNWFFNCIETGEYTEPPWRKSSTSNTNVEMFNEFIN